MSRVLHYAVDGTFFDYDDGRYEQVPACGNDFRGRKKLTDDHEAVTCKTCRELLGLNAAPVAVTLPKPEWSNQSILTDEMADFDRQAAA